MIKHLNQCTALVLLKQFSIRLIRE